MAVAFSFLRPTARDGLSGGRRRGIFSQILGGPAMIQAAALLVAFGIGIAALLWSVRSAGPRLDPQPWVLADTAKQHVTIMGGLAGFAVTGIVLIVSFANNHAGAAAAARDTVVVMFVVAYFYYVGNAFLISYAPNPATAGDVVPRVHFSLASTIEYRTLFVSWFALMPLLEANGLVQPARVLSYLLPASLMLGSSIIAMAADGLGLVRLRETYISAAIGTGLALLYGALAWYVLPGLRSPDASLVVTIAVFLINGLGYAMAALTPLAAHHPAVAQFYGRYGRQLVLIDMQLTMTVLAFLWLAVAGVI